MQRSLDCHFHCLAYRLDHATHVLKHLVSAAGGMPSRSVGMLGRVGLGRGFALIPGPSPAGKRGQVLRFTQNDQ